MKKKLRNTMECLDYFSSFILLGCIFRGPSNSVAAIAFVIIINEILLDVMRHKEKLQKEEDSNE